MYNYVDIGFNDFISFIEKHNAKIENYTITSIPDYHTGKKVYYRNCVFCDSVRRFRVDIIVFCSAWIVKISKNGYILTFDYENRQKLVITSIILVSHFII